MYSYCSKWSLVVFDKPRRISVRDLKSILRYNGSKLHMTQYRLTLREYVKIRKQYMVDIFRFTVFNIFPVYLKMKDTLDRMNTFLACEY